MQLQLNLYTSSQKNEEEGKSGILTRRTRMTLRGGLHLSLLFQIEVWLLLATCIMELATGSLDGELPTANLV